jgi:hypothetical protein
MSLTKCGAFRHVVLDQLPPLCQLHFQKTNSDVLVQKADNDNKKLSVTEVVQRCRQEKEEECQWHRQNRLENLRASLSRTGAYAITDLVVRLDQPDVLETDFRQAVTQVAETLPRYLNLRSLHIKAPFAALDGQLLSNILSINAPFEELDLDIWAFYSPCSSMWNNVKKKKLRRLCVTLNDGMAFPSSCADLLSGLRQAQNREMDYFNITNATPHPISVPRALLPRARMLVMERIEVKRGPWFF